MTNDTGYPKTPGLERVARQVIAALDALPPPA